VSPLAAAPPERRRTAFAEGADRLRAAATTEPGRLRAIGAVLALLVVAFGAVTAWQMTERAGAADDVLNRSQPLSSDAADIYRSLADANTAAASGYLAGLQEKPAMREGYEKDIGTAASKLVTAAANSEAGSSSAGTIAELGRLLPEYKGLVETARANNRQGYPVGGAYLRAANKMMQDEMLPAAQRLYRTENQRLGADYAAAKSFPWLAAGLGVLAVAALVWAQRRNYRRTNRVLNHGLVTATAAATVVLLWLTVSHTLARAGLNDSYDNGVRSLAVLHEARIASLTARSDENLTLVSRGADTRTLDDGSVVDTYASGYDREIGVLARALARAAALSDDTAGRKPVQDADGFMKVWKQRNALARQDNDSGNYQAARDRVIGAAKEPTSVCFTNVDKALAVALDHEQGEFRQAARDGRGWLTGLPAGSAVLGVLGAAGAVLGIGRRLSEYR
ncbi:secreted protein, partial [Streptomyces zinciresistens K42]